MRRPELQQGRRFARTAGVTLIEVSIVVAIVAVLSLAGGMVITEWSSSQRARGAARDMADLALLARAEAVRTGTPHLAFFGTGGLQAPDGTPASALVARDDDEDGVYDAPGEFVAAVASDTTGTLSWGWTSADVPAPADPTPDHANPPPASWTFPGGPGTQSAVFMPDGTPRSYTITPLSAGNMGTGAGALYVTSGGRDYAVVVTGLGSVRVHAWDSEAAAWRQ